MFCLFDGWEADKVLPVYPEEMFIAQQVLDLVQRIIHKMFLLIKAHYGGAFMFNVEVCNAFSSNCEILIAFKNHKTALAYLRIHSHQNAIDIGSYRLREEIAVHICPFDRIKIVLFQLSLHFVIFLFV